STQVNRYGLAGLRPLAATSALPVSLQMVGLDAIGDTVLVRGLTTIACVNASDGRSTASTNPTGSPPPFVSELATGPDLPRGDGSSQLLALTSSGIGSLAVPASCLGAA
ncbi:MAG: hypothetical protein ACRDZP_06090, partial [Acidimicrobiales bacterium]